MAQTSDRKMSGMNRYIITQEKIKTKPGQEQKFHVLALYDGARKMTEVTLTPPDEECILGNIYIGRVENVVQNIRAAFVKISPDITCYLSLDDLKNAFFTKKQSVRKEIAAGDELLVQVVREALKTKEPAVTANLSFAGKYAVLTTANRRLGISSKLSKEQKVSYKELLREFDCDAYGLIVRTNAAGVSDETLVQEIRTLEKEWLDMKENAVHKTCYSVLKKAKPSYLEELKNQPEGSIEEILTDDRAVFETVCMEYGIRKEQFVTGGSVSVPVDQFVIPVRNAANGQTGNLYLTYYKDPMISLSALYSVKASLEKALRTQVWLNSGASIIIEHTEALTVIDVNSGKNLARKEMRENLLRINLEAAKEIAYQLRLRNISGMILIDFINLLSKEDEAVLLKEFRSYLRKDPVKADLIDMTKLGLVEVTRKKIKKSLRDSLNLNL